MKPKIDREIKISDDNEVIETISTINERFTRKEFENTIKNKQMGLENLRNQKRQIEMSMERNAVNSAESADLQKAKRLLGEAKLRKVIEEYMNRESYKRNKENLESIENEIEIVEKDVERFKKALEQK